MTILANYYAKQTSKGYLNTVQCPIGYCCQTEKYISTSQNALTGKSERTINVWCVITWIK